MESKFTEATTNRDDHLSKKALGRLKPGVFATLDANSDSKITGYEFDQTNLTDFPTIDANQDGGATLEVLKAYLNAMRKK